MIIVSCAEKVPSLIEKDSPDCVLSIASKAEIASDLE